MSQKTAITGQFKASDQTLLTVFLKSLQKSESQEIRTFVITFFDVQLIFALMGIFSNFSLTWIVSQDKPLSRAAGRHEQ